MAEREARAGGLDLFISYSPADERWATWMAWQLESASYTTMLQAWDFVPGTNFIDFMDRGVRTATAVIAVLSRAYMASTYGRLEWQATLRADPDNLSNRLVTVRIDESPLEGLLSMITYVDLVGVDDAAEGRRRLLARVGDALAGRAKPTVGPGYPPGDDVTRPEPDVPPVTTPPRRQRAPGQAPVYPPQIVAREGRRTSVTVLHVEGPRFGRGLVDVGAPTTAEDLQSHIWGDLTRLDRAGAPRPDLLVVTGDLTESGGVHEFADATEFLTGLRVLLRLEPHRVVVVPGARDVTRLACRAYFDTCEVDAITPKPPYWPKWRHYTRMFGDLYEGLDDLAFDSQQPWTLFALPDLRVAVAGLNSTMAISHREQDHHGWLGTAQLAWFAERLADFEERGWLRLGAMGHVPPTVPEAGGPAPAGQAAPEALRDGPTFDRLLGGRLNLLLHGAAAGSDARHIGRTGSGLTVVPPCGAGRHQLVTLHAGGLTRWPGQLDADDDGPPSGPRPHGTERLDRRWTNVAAALPPPPPTGHGPGPDAGDRPGRGDGDRPEGGDGDQGDERDEARPAATGLEGARPSDRPPERQTPAELLLDRIAEVCRARHDRPRLRRGPGEPPNLWVTFSEDGVTRHQRVAAHSGPVDRDALERFLSEVHAADPDVASELVYSGPPAPQSLRDEARRRGVRLRSFIEFQGLLDLREFVARQTLRLERDPVYPPKLHVPQRYHDLGGADRTTTHTGLTDELLRLVSAEDGRFVLVLGEFGRGKTFALREVARRIPAELPHLVPIFIELRALDKAHSVDGLVAAHLAGHGEDLHLKAFRYMLREGRIVLLFDGFDELASRVTYDRATEHLETLLQAFEGKAKVVVSSRTQHFRTDDQVLTALGQRIGLLPHRRVLSISNFAETQIHEYLVNRYAGAADAADARMAFIRTNKLLGLCQNPRMLSFIAELDPGRLEELAQASDVVSTAQLYEEILGAWMDFEVERSGRMGGAPSSLDKGDLWQAVTTLALRLYESNEPYLRLDALTDTAETLIRATKPATEADRPMSTDEKVHAIGTGSLLVRTEDGLFGFIHSSVVEWLVAKDIGAALDGAVGAGAALLARRALSQPTVDFLCDLGDRAVLQRWCAVTLADTDAPDPARRNALKVTARLQLAAWADLRGVSLEGEDLSHRDLTSADLRGANLTNALLVGSNLSQANLSQARLVGANLDGANMTGADLSGADLDGARLFRTRLRGVRLGASRWRRAALVATSRDEGFDAAPELRGAAIAPGHPVEVQLAPAVASASYGFEIGRLPRPLAFTADGSTVAIGGDDGGVLLCDVASGLPVRTLRGHEGRVYAVVCGPGDAPLATGGADATVRLWDQVTGVLRHVLRGHDDWVWPVVLSPGGDAVAVGDSSGTVRLWDTGTGEPAARLPGHAARVWTLRFRPDGRMVASGDDEGVMRLWDAATGQPAGQMVAPGGAGVPVYRLLFSPDGTAMATGHDGGAVRIWDMASRSVRHELVGHAASVYTLDFHPTGDVLATGDTRGEVRLWDAGSGRLLATLERQTGAVYHVRFSRAGDLLATGDSDGAVRLWDARRGDLRHELMGHKSSVWPMAFSPDGSQLATASNDDSARLWSTASGQCRHVLRGHGRRVASVRFSADASLLATCGSDGVVRLWDAVTGECREQLTGRAGQLLSAVFSPRGSQLATASNDGRVYLWHAGSGDYVRAVNVETEYVWAASFSPDGDVLATANDDDTVQLRYGSTGRLIRVLGEHRGRVRSIEFHRTRNLLATGCDDRVVRIWDLDGGVCRSSLTGHGDRVYSVDFSATQELLVSASTDGLARIWDFEAGELLRQVGTPGVPMWSAAFSPDGRLLVTAGDDQAVTFWDVATGELVGQLTAHSQRIRSVTYSRDGRLLASASDDGSLMLWDVGGDEPALRLTLLGLPDGWAAIAPDGRYKFDGDIAGAFWHVIGVRRFEAGELDAYLSNIDRLAARTPF